jgi:hypothetical protein
MRRPGSSSPKPGARGGATGAPGERRPSPGAKPGARGGATGSPGARRPSFGPNPGARGGAMGLPGSFLPGVLPKPGARGRLIGAPGSFLPGVLPKPGARGRLIGSPGSLRPGVLPKPGARGRSMGRPSGTRLPGRVLGPLSGREGETAGSPGPRRLGVTVGSGASGEIGSFGSLRPGTVSGAGPSGLGVGDTGFAGGAAGTGGVNCATANWLAKPIVASATAIGPRDARAWPLRRLLVGCWRARMAGFSKQSGFAGAALTRETAAYTSPDAFRIGLRARALLRERKDLRNLRGNRVHHAGGSRKTTEFREVSGRPPPHDRAARVRASVRKGLR